MRLTSSRAYTRPISVPKMPPGLVELMEGLARDVLKNNPTNVYEFCANHMEKVLEIRDGPSSKKFLTLEQKILKAQEKVRQRAKERQEIYDNEIKLHSNKSDGETTAYKSDSLLLQEDPAVPSLKVPIHHDYDIEHASEVEISHVPHATAPLSEDASKREEFNIIEETHKGTNENIEGAENVYFESITYIIPQNEPIIAKVEKEVIKEPEIIKMVQEEVADLQLQTIADASDENFEGTISLLPVITIGDESDILVPENITQECVQDGQLNVGNEHEKENSVMTVKPAEFEIKCKELPEKADSNVLVKKTSEYESITLKSYATDAENIVSVSINDHDKNLGNDQSTVLIADKEKQKGICETPQTSEIINVPIATNSVEKDSDNSNVLNTNQPESSNVTSDIVHNSDSQNLAISSADVPNAGGVLQDENSKNEQIHKNIDKDEKQNIQTTNNKHENSLTVAENGAVAKIIKFDGETKADDKFDVVENTNAKADSMTLEIENDKSESEEIQHKLETNDQRLDHNDDENRQILLQKSDSAENTNEDSISILESYLSKTDDDSTQNNSNNMDLETAAVTIQKVFRSFMFKSRNSTFDDNANGERNSIDEENDKKEEYYAAANINKERRPLGITRMDTVLQTVNEEKSLSLSTDDSSTLSSAATTIQAHVRGYLVRSRHNSSKTFSMNSLVNSHEVLEYDSEPQKNKTVLNIHIVPEEGNYLSRDESLITSMDLSLDGSPPSSVNLHPLSCDISERRKTLKREDAVQSASPPSNNSGKLSEDSVKEMLINENGLLEGQPTDDKTNGTEDLSKDIGNEVGELMSSASTVTPTTVVTLSKSEDPLRSPREHPEMTLQRTGRSFTKISSDESDVITPFVPSPRISDDDTRLLHSGEFHDVPLPTKVSRNDAPVVREFKNVLVYFLLWNNS